LKNEATDLLDNKGPGLPRIGNEATVGGAESVGSWQEEEEKARAKGKRQKSEN